MESNKNRHYTAIVEKIGPDNSITLRIKDAACPLLTYYSDFILVQCLTIGQEIDLELESKYDIADVLDVRPEKELSCIEKENDNVENQ